MSEARVRQLQRETQDLQRKIGAESSKVARERKKAGDARRAASRTNSLQTARTKRRQAEQADSRATDAEKKRSDAELKLAKKQSDLVRAEQRLDNEREQSRARALDGVTADARRRDAEVQAVLAATARGVAPRTTGSGAQSDATYDLFISHASEDKQEIAGPLVEALREHQLEVWYDELVLEVGDSLRQKIDQGLAASRFGVVILSPSFFAKPWPQRELDGLVARETGSGEKLVLPVWHRVTEEEVLARSSLLAGLVGLSTRKLTVSEIADALAKVAMPRGG